VKRVHTYRRLPLEHPGSRSKISEQAVVRAHDRTLPLKLKMFASANRAQKTMAASEGKDEAHDWENPKVRLQLLPGGLGNPVLTGNGTDNDPVVNNTDRTGTKIRINKKKGEKLPELRYRYGTGFFPRG